MNAGTIVTIIVAIVVLVLLVFAVFSKPQNNFAKPRGYRPKVQPDLEKAFPLKYESGWRCDHRGHYQVTTEGEYTIRYCTMCGKTWKSTGNSQWKEFKEEHQAHSDNPLLNRPPNHDLEIWIQRP